MTAYQTPPLPLIVLAGSDRRPAALPDDVEGLHSLSGYKAVDVKIGGRPIIDLLLERLEQSGLFDPIYVAGPRRVYGESRGRATVIDTDGSFSENIEAAITHVGRECPGRSVGFATCDILPEVNELHTLLDDYYANAPLDFWFPMILAPEGGRELGASSWKPEYRIAPSAGEEPKTLLPGHLVVADPSAFRLPLVYRSFNLAYRSRNRSVIYRLRLILSHVFGGLLLQDLHHLLAFRLPTITVTVALHGILLAIRLARGESSSDELADRLHKIFISYRHRRRFPELTGRMPLMPGLSLAKDIDTVEEAQELARELE
ncbi:MAG: hypothetical protein ACE5GX_04245 [Thermoanaerobaculia bacterium]